MLEQKHCLIYRPARIASQVSFELLNTTSALGLNKIRFFIPIQPVLVMLCFKTKTFSLFHARKLAYHKYCNLDHLPPQFVVISKLKITRTHEIIMYLHSKMSHILTY